MKLLPEIRRRVEHAKATLGTAANVARQYDVPEEAVRRLLQGKSLHGDNYKRFVEAFGLGEPTAEALHRAAHDTAMNLKRLQEIRGYARFVYDQLVTLASQQGQVVRALEPWCELEEHAEKQELRDTAAATLRAASQGASPAASGTPARRRRRGQG